MQARGPRFRYGSPVSNGVLPQWLRNSRHDHRGPFPLRYSLPSGFGAARGHLAGVCGCKQGQDRKLAPGALNRQASGARPSAVANPIQAGTDRCENVGSVLTENSLMKSGSKTASRKACSSESIFEQFSYQIPVCLGLNFQSTAKVTLQFSGPPLRSFSVKRSQNVMASTNKQISTCAFTGKPVIILAMKTNAR